ncbi:hypothetical protein AGMMS49574_11050 [Bacteroidia bacterium]|nr:hypothetical protein AGMMS49574_11050 [Bacteroidia bacterium]
MKKEQSNGSITILVLSNNIYVITRENIPYCDYLIVCTSSKTFPIQCQMALTALLGAMLETLHPEEDTSAMWNALNPQTFYKLSVSDKILSNQKKWT